MLSFLSHSAYDEHKMHEGHPERPERTQSILSHLKETGQWPGFKHLQACPVTAEALQRVHEPLYLKKISTSAPASGLVMIDPDTHLCPLEQVLGDQLATSAEVLSQVPTHQFAFGEVPVPMDEDGHFPLE